MSELLIGTGGVPHSAQDPSLEAGVRRIHELGLDCLEAEFVHGVRMGTEAAERVGRLAADLKIALTCHGPYYINLNAVEPEKRAASVRRILDTARVGRALGAGSITFHPGFYLGQDPEAVHATIREGLAGIAATLAAEGNRVPISPELTGKPTQFGSLEELLRLCREVENLHLCLDFAHAHARSGGAVNSYAEFRGMLETVERALGHPALERLHLHVAGIEYTPKGERQHLDLEESDLRWRELLQALKEMGVGGWLICESPSLEADAVLLKEAWRKL